MQPTDLLHLSLGYAGLGGVESMLHRHHAADARNGFRSRFLVLFEAGPDSDPRVRFAGLTPQTTIRATRRTLRQLAGPPPAVAVYHAIYAMTFFADLDQAQRRIAFLHGYSPGLERMIAAKAKWFDGILCVSEPLQATVRGCLPAFDPARIAYIPYPIDPPATPASANVHRPTPTPAPAGPRPLVLGFSGRLVKEQKRIDRLPELFRRLDALGVRYQMEFLGDGADRAWLEQSLAGPSRFVFHGRQSGPDYWRILSGWDVILFVSDYEGTPISLIEAMNRGVLPVYPRINTGGDAYASATAEPLLYPAGDLEAAARAIHWLSERSAAEIATLRETARAQVARHDATNYHRTFGTFIAQIQNAPRIGQARWPIRPFPLDVFSFAGIARGAELVRAPRRWLGRPRAV